jgi:RNA polymerase sigma factor (sigma-70 family)
MAFPTTRWSRVVDAASEDPETRRRALEDLLRAYWRPIYCSVRFGWRATEVDAEDHVQEFFTSLLERDFAKDLDPSRGSLRSFLKAALKHHLLNARRDSGRAKRGGGRARLALDGVADLVAAPGSLEEVLDASWARQVVTDAVKSLRETLEREGRGATFVAFERYDLSPTGTTYAEVARLLGCSEGDVRNRLHHARRRLREIVRERVAEYTRDDREAAEELAWILG